MRPAHQKRSQTWQVRLPWWLAEQPLWWRLQMVPLGLRLRQPVWLAYRKRSRLQLAYLSLILRLVLALQS
jgi:hypothetical protein